MKASDLYKELINKVGSLLKESKFSRKGSCFYRQQESCWGLVDFQKSRKSNTEEILFTINIGICSGRLLEFFSPDSLMQKPSIEACHWRERVGFLLPERQDKWWVIHTSELLDPLATELKDCLDSIIIPAVEQNLSEERLSKVWLSGNSPGLTDIQRLMYLSVLLKAADADRELREVLRELEEKSTGKPSEIMVKKHLKDLGLI